MIGINIPSKKFSNISLRKFPPMNTILNIENITKNNIG